MSTRRLSAFFLGLIMAIIIGSELQSPPAYAATEIEKLQSEIKQKNDRLAAIEAEIAQFESALKEVGAEKDTLQKAINQLELERKKVNADITYTENKIASTDLTIEKLLFEIERAESDITRNESAIGVILKKIYIDGNESMVELFLSEETISELWDSFEHLEEVKGSIIGKVDELEDLKLVLESKRDENTEYKKELESLKRQYDDQHSILANNKADKAELLSQTQNEEANYQSLLAQKEAAKEQLLKEVQDIELQIKFILDPSTIPGAGNAVFRWPVDNPYITQYFGYTRFALSGAYNGNAHNGMDLGAPVGTKIYAPLSGTVRNVGNTDAVPGCYSWGKWILVDHPNGLSTMFAHLSQISVSPGQKVATGDIIGYVGNTGYSTGPHLHFTVYVSDGVQVKQFNQYKAVTGCGAALSPFAAVEAYLDPLDYLPPL